MHKVAYPLIFMTVASLLAGPASFCFPVAGYAGVAVMSMAFHRTGRYVEESA